MEQVSTNPTFIIPTWGTGTDKKTMALHIKRAVYSELGWKGGDFLILTPDYENNRIILEKLDIQKAKKGSDTVEDEHQGTKHK